eukprot:3401276-Rhodomonas_salina.1
MCSDPAKSKAKHMGLGLLLALVLVVVLVLETEGSEAVEPRFGVALALGKYVCAYAQLCPHKFVQFWLQIRHVGRWDNVPRMGKRVFSRDAVFTTRGRIVSGIVEHFWLSRC